MPSERARSLPRPAGTIAIAAPLPATPLATSRTSPSPPTATAIRFSAAAAAASSTACSALRVSSTRTSAPAALIRAPSPAHFSAALPPPEIGLTSAVNARMSAHQDPGVEDPGGVQRSLHRAQCLERELADLRLVGRAVVGADAVVVGDRGAAGTDRRVHRGLR